MSSSNPITSEVPRRGMVVKVISNEPNGAGLIYEGDLEHYFRVLFHSALNLASPYHNLRHMLYVTCACYEACEYYVLHGAQIPLRRARNLLIAGIFHDFDHSGRVGHDDLEVIRAIRGMRRHLRPEDQSEVEEIAALMQATKFPYEELSQNLSLEAQILRDADLSQALNDVWMQQILVGLAQEMNITPLKMLQSQVQFLSGLKFTTEWAQKRFTPQLTERKLEEVRGLLYILEERS